MKYVILIPIYNDRESLKLLIENINNVLNDLNHEISLVVINDASTQQIIDTYPSTDNINSIKSIFSRLWKLNSFFSSDASLIMK